MKTKNWQPWMIAMAAHAVLVWVLLSRPGTPLTLEATDMIGAEGPFSVAVEIDLTGEQSATCEVHRVLMIEELVPVLSAVPSKDEPAGADRNEPPRGVREKLFPHSEHFVFGAYGTGDVRDARVRICPECRSAEARWRAATPIANR